MTDPSPVVGGHGPHDDQPHWTVDETDELVGPSGCTYYKDWATRSGALPGDWAALVRHVRDAAEVQTLRDQVAAASSLRHSKNTLDDLDVFLDNHAPCDADLEAGTNGAAEWRELRKWCDDMHRINRTREAAVLDATRDNHDD